MRAEEIKGLMEAYSQVHETAEVFSEEEIFVTVANALISQGYSAIDVLEYFSSVDEEVIIEDVIALSEGTLIIENSVAEEYIEEQFEQLNEYVGAALRLGQAAVKGAQFAQKTGMLARAGGALRAAGTAATRMAQQGGTKASAVVRPALGKAVQNVKGAVSGAIQKVKGAASGVANKVPGGPGGKLASAGRLVGKAALGGAAFEAGMRGVGAIANKVAGSKPVASPVAAKPTQSKFAGARDAAFAKAKTIQGSPVVGSKPTPAAKPAATPAAKPAATATSKPTTPAAPAKPAGSAMDQWAKANPKLAAAKSEIDRTRGTSATTNPLMKDMKSSMPAPKSPAPSTASTGFGLAKKGVNLAAGVDIFDLVKGHLLDEGYADSEEGAMVIMVNMSEEWRESILESYGVEILDEVSKTDDTTRRLIKQYAGKKGISFEPGPRWDPAANRGKGANLSTKQIEKQRRKSLRNEELEVIDEVSKTDDGTRARIAMYAGKKGISFEPGPRWDPSANRGKGANLSPKQVEKQRRKALRNEDLEAWVDELIAEGYDLSEYTWEEVAEIYAQELELVDEGKSSRPRYPGGRGVLDQETRDEKREAHAENRKGHTAGPGTVTKNTKKLRKQKAMGEIGEEYMDEAQRARENPEDHDEKEKKKYEPVRGERTPMPPRGDKRREDFEKWYAKNVR